MLAADLMMALLGRTQLLRLCRCGRQPTLPSHFSTFQSLRSKNVELTSVRYSDLLKSKKHFAKLTSGDVEHFK